MTWRPSGPHRRQLPSPAGGSVSVGPARNPSGSTRAGPHHVTSPAESLRQIPIHSRTPLVPRSGAARDAGQWTGSVDSSRSCPQECAQAGEIFLGRPRIAPPTPGGHPDDTTLCHAARAGTRLTCTDAVQPEPGHAALLRWGSEGRNGWGRSGERQGTAGGGRTVTVHNRRDVHVSTQVMRSPPTACQQADSADDQRGHPRSPASTRVMTKMSYLDREFLEPHSGWGSPVPRGSGGQRDAVRDRRSHRGPQQAP